MNDATNDTNNKKDEDGQKNKEPSINGKGQQWSLRDFQENKKKEILITDPDWQRNAVWSNKRKSALIDSLIMGVPIPVIYLSKEVKIIDNNFEKITYRVIDGKQRIETVVSYLNDGWAISRSEEIRSKNIKNLKFNSLNDNLKNNLLNTKMDCIEVEDPSSDLLEEIFKRINTKGVPLNSM